jgi:hypothetical protein
MKKKQVVRMKSVTRKSDIDRSFVVIPEISPDHWRENLDMFFDEKEAGQDHMRRLREMSKTDIDHYFFTGGYDMPQMSARKPDSGLAPKTAMMTTARLGDAIPVYESAGSFRYAMP